MTDHIPGQKQPGAETLLGRIRRSILQGFDTEGFSDLMSLRLDSSVTSAIRSVL